MTVTAIDGQMPECSEIGLMLGAAGDGELEPNDLQEVTHHLNRMRLVHRRAQSDYSTIGRELREIAVKPSLEGFTKSVLDVIAKLVAVAHACDRAAQRDRRSQPPNKSRRQWPTKQKPARSVECRAIGQVG